MRLCLFCSYSSTSYIDNYIKHYVRELLRHFDKVMFLTNQRDIVQEDIEFLKTNGIELRMFENKGFDFGMYYHVIKDLDVSKLDSLSLVNDSCYLIKPLNNYFQWQKTTGFDVAGITDSVQLGHHVQSYFLTFSKRSLLNVKNYFITHGVITDVHRLIQVYEIGLCKELRNAGFKIGALYSHKSFNCNSNIMTERVQELLQKGIPVIKRKIVNGTFRPDETSYLESVKFDFTINYKNLLYSYVDKTILDYIFQNHVTKVYQIYYDKSQLGELSSTVMPYYNKDLSPYFENDVVVNLYNNKKITGDYFGILSWRFKTKNGFMFNTNQIDGRYDMYTFSGAVRHHNVLKDSVDCHPGFEELFKPVLKNLGIDYDKMVHPNFGIYMNSVICRTDIYLHYIKDWLLPTIEFLEKLKHENEELNAVLWSDAKYIYSPQLTPRLLQYLGKPYYTYHTFICERLWSIFYEINKNKYTLKVVYGADAQPAVKRSQHVHVEKNPIVVERGSQVEEHRSVLENTPSMNKSKDYAACIVHSGSKHNLEKIHPENKSFDFFMISTENLDISRWQNSFRKNEIASLKHLDDVQTKLNKQTLQSLYMCSSVNKMWQEQETINRQKYKMVVYCNSLMGLSQPLDFYKIKMNINTIYIKKNVYKYWFGRSELMLVFNQLFEDQLSFSSGSFDDVVMQFALRRNIKIVEI